MIAVSLRFGVTVESAVRFDGHVGGVNHHFQAVADTAENRIEVLIDFLLQENENK